jgi:hypothetical protein
LFFFVSLVEFLQQDGEEHVQKDFLSKDNKGHPEYCRSNRAHCPVVIVVNGALTIISQNDIDCEETVHEIVEVKSRAFSLIRIQTYINYLILTVELRLIGKELETEHCVDEEN